MKIRKHLSADGLFRLVRKEFGEICQRQLERDMATTRNTHGNDSGEAHASGGFWMRFAASSALWLGTSFPNSTMML